MRLHRLTLRALGPFADEQHVDFDALGASGLFLLEGPTGAGKSTVLDAITFALYGEPAGQTTSRARLVSDLAPADAEPYAELDFSVSGVRHRLIRVPAHRRAKRRGSGTTQDPGRVCLQRIESDGTTTTLSTRADEVGDEVVRLLGLTRLQFTQVVVLPQGEFARFLQAPAEQRRELLERLFGTEVYDALQDQVLALRREATAAVEAAERDVDTAVAALAAAAGVEPPAEDVDQGDWAETVVSALGERTAQVHVAVAAAGEELASARDALAVARRHAEALQRRQALRDREAELAALAADRAADRIRLAAADRAAEVEPLLEELAAAARQRGDAESAAAAALRSVASCTAATTAPDDDLVRALPAAGRAAGGLEPARYEPAGLDDRTLTAAARTARRRAASLAAVVAREERLPELVELVALHEKTMLETDRRLEELAEVTRLFPARVEAATARLDERRRAAAELPELRLRVAGAAARAEAAAAWLLAVDAVEDAAAEVRRRGDEARAAVDAHQALLQRRLDGMAGELAAGLVPGEACPVCGGTEHPAPALPGDDAVSAAMVDAAEKVRRRAEAAADAARRALAAAEAETAGLAALALAGTEDAVPGVAGRDGTALLPLVDPDALAAEADRLAAAVAVAEAVAADLPDAEAELHAVTAERAEADRIRTELDGVLTRARADHAAAAATEAAERAAVVAETGDWPSVAARVAGLEELAELLAEAGEALTAVARASAAERRLHARAVARARRAGFGIEAAAPDGADRAAADGGHRAGADGADGGADGAEDGRECLLAAAAAVLSAAARAELRGRVSSYDTECATVAAGLDDPTLAGLDDGPAPDLLRVQQTALAAEQRWQSLHEECAVVETRARDATTRAADLTAAVARLAAAEAAAAPARRMADLVTGGQGNQRRMTLATYVLRSRFLSVVAAASRRLERMSSGRYSFAFEEEGSGNQRAGLGLVVVDEFSGRRRPVATLSGGETFYASLALALGLADVVRSEAGGVELETLFVDEGFGSLDPDTLEQVLGVLDDLRDAGRVVGVVSHVAELKERVPDRLEVRRLPSGASMLRQRS